jgi:hypothetical protein
MNIVSLNFSGINANRQSAIRGGVSIKNNIKIDSVEVANIGLDSTRQAFKALFTFTTEYSPNFALIEIKGDVLMLGLPDEVKGILSMWDKEKKLEPEIGKAILNSVMNRCSLEVILLSKELGLPSPIPLPTIRDEDTPVKTFVQKTDTPVSKSKTEPQKSFEQKGKSEPKKKK